MQRVEIRVIAGHVQYSTVQYSTVQYSTYLGETPYLPPHAAYDGILKYISLTDPDSTNFSSWFGAS